MTKLYSHNIIQPSLTFDPIYELGRKLRPAESIIFHEIEKNESVDVRSLIRAFLQFIQRDTRATFIPALAELSLFDPADPSGNRFYTLLSGTSNKDLRAYISEMVANLDAKLPLRGAILPQENLYTAPYYHGSLDIKKTFTPLDPQDLHIQIGSFEVKNSLSDEIETVNSFVKGFFKAVAKQLEDPKGKYELNTALLIPLYRPAAPIDRNQQNIFRGGGLFLFGYTDENFNVDAFALELQSLLLKLVFEASHSQIEVEKLKFLQANLELGTYHHFSTNLRKIPGYLDPQNFGTENLDHTQVKKLEILSDSINYCIDNILSGLNSYKAFLNSEHNPQQQYSTVRELAHQLEKHRQAMSDHNILYALSPEHIQLEVDQEILDWQLPFAYEALMPHMLELLGNIEKEYEIEEVPSDDRKVNISIRKQANQSITFTITNSCTQFNQFVMEQGGKRPLNSVASSGLGLYFLNFSLGIFGAQHDAEQGRNFHLENHQGPNRASLSFTFPKQYSNE